MGLSYWYLLASIQKDKWQQPDHGNGAGLKGPGSEFRAGREHQIPLHLISRFKDMRISGEQGKWPAPLENT